MNKKVIFTIIAVALVVIYILWNRYQERLDKQRQQEFNQRATQEWVSYNICMEAVEEKYRSNLKSLNSVSLSKKEIDNELTQYQEQYDQQSFECHKQYPAAATKRISQEILDQKNELRNRNYMSQ